MLGPPRRRRRGARRPPLARGRAPAARRRFPTDPGDEEPDRVDLRDLFAFTIDPETSEGLRRRPQLPRARATASAPGCTSPTSAPTCPAGSPLDRGRRRARLLRPTCRAASSRCFPSSSPHDLCSLRPHEDRRCVTVEVLVRRRPEIAGEPLFYRSVIRSRERLTYSHAQAILAGAERAADETRPRRSAWPSAWRRSFAARRFARGALGSRRARPPSRSTARAASSARGSRRSRSPTRSSRS